MYDRPQSYASGDSDVALLISASGDDFDRVVRSFGDREALVERASGARWTYAELAGDADALALGLLKLGVAQGDRVGIWAPKRAEWVQVQYATAKIGAILVNINPSYRVRALSGPDRARPLGLARPEASAKQSWTPEESGSVTSPLGRPVGARTSEPAVMPG